MKPTSRWTVAVPPVIGVALAAVVFAAVYPSLGSHRPETNEVCLSNVRQIGLSTVIYCADWDDRELADRDRWVELTLVYGKSETPYRCPDLKPFRTGYYGYAFNSWLSSRTEASMKDMSVVPAVYDSINFARNASDRFVSFPVWPAGKEKPRRNVGFSDGHAMYERASWAGWKP